MRHRKATKNIRLYTPLGVCVLFGLANKWNNVLWTHTLLEVCVRPNMPDNIISYVRYDIYIIYMCHLNRPTHLWGKSLPFTFFYPVPNQIENVLHSWREFSEATRCSDNSADSLYIRVVRKKSSFQFAIVWKSKRLTLCSNVVWCSVVNLKSIPWRMLNFT